MHKEKERTSLKAKPKTKRWSTDKMKKTTPPNKKIKENKRNKIKVSIWSPSQ